MALGKQHRACDLLVVPTGVKLDLSVACCLLHHGPDVLTNCMVRLSRGLSRMPRGCAVDYRVKGATEYSCHNYSGEYRSCLLGGDDAILLFLLMVDL